MKSAAKSAEFLPLPQHIKKFFVKIGADIQISEGYDLQFFNSKLTIDKENFENFMRHVENKKIADEAGMGKINDSYSHRFEVEGKLP